MTANKILEIAQGELGEREFPPSSNCVKYNTAYYGRAVSGPQYAWCAAFVWWCFRQAGASELYYGGGKTAYCPTLLAWHRKHGQAVQGDYRPGDIIFFNFAGKSNAAHVGICESWDGSYITTIDGNTGSGNDANGGAVMRRRRAKKYIVGAYRPKYEEECGLTEEQVRTIVREELAGAAEERAKWLPSAWAAPLLAEAVRLGITDGSRPQAYATREEVALISLATMKK